MDCTRVKVLDDHHIMIDGKQYVSLKRFFENRSEIALENKILVEENERLIEENKHLKALLKESFD